MLRIFRNNEKLLDPLVDNNFNNKKTCMELQTQLAQNICNSTSNASCKSLQFA